MKPFSKIFCFLFAASTLALQINTNINNKNVITQITYDENADCKTSIVEYKECFADNKSKVNLEIIDEVCDKFLTEKCKKFYEEGISKLKGCEKISEEMLNQYTLKYDIKGIVLSELCSRDENGQYCPISKFLQSGSTNRRELDECINNTCKSKKCVDDAIDYTTREMDFDKRLNDFLDKTTSSNITSSSNIKRQYDGSKISEEEENQAILEFLKSDYCSAHITTTANSRSAAISTIQYSNVLLTFIGLLLFALI
ncbi:hypothetical protein H8356DRAFT_1725237 [Neocallimastix lanati (nom. inval.)]|jgi:hypothetical protein|nr:hypothetical protein H8356DRAFT_1725237 [Neocallimastix sp. JGI-2020a]